MVRKIVHVTLFLSLIIIVHESGHFAAARYFGIPVEEFAFGFGPKILEKRLYGTNFTLNAIPLGGYIETKREAIRSASLGAQAIICVAGMLLNVLVCSFVIYAIRPWKKRENRLRFVPKPFRRLVVSIFLPFGLWVTAPVQFWRSLVNLKIGWKDATPIPAYEQYTEETDGLYYFAFLNVAIAGMNLIPLVPFDGGELVIVGLKAIQVSTKYYLVGIGLLLIWGDYLLTKMLLQKWRRT